MHSEVASPFTAQRRWHWRLTLSSGASAGHCRVHIRHISGAKNGTHPRSADVLLCDAALRGTTMYICLFVYMCMAFGFHCGRLLARLVICQTGNTFINSHHANYGIYVRSLKSASKTPVDTNHAIVIELVSAALSCMCSIPISYIHRVANAIFFFIYYYCIHFGVN